MLENKSLTARCKDLALKLETEKRQALFDCVSAEKTLAVRRVRVRVRGCVGECVCVCVCACALISPYFAFHVLEAA